MIWSFRHLPVAAVLLITAAVPPSSLRASPWQRRELLRSPLAINLHHPDLRFLDDAGPGDLLLWGGKLRVRAPGVSAETIASIAPAIEARLRDSLDSWDVPFSASDPIRLLIVASGEAPFSEVFSLAGEGGADREPVIALNVTGQTDAEIAAEAVRDVGSFVLRRLAPGVDDALVFAAARAVSISGDLLDSDRQEIREAGSSPVNSLERREGEIFAAAWIDEMAAGAGSSFVSSVWTRRVATGESTLLAFARAYAEATHQSPWDAFQRSLERDYSRTEVFGDLSRLTDRDREAGALDASSPAPLSWKFFSADIDPAAGPSAGLNVSWPGDAARGFAVLHYEDSLPSDVVRFAPGESKTLPLSGVSRIDWIVAGSDRAGSALAAPGADFSSGEFSAFRAFGSRCRRARPGRIARMEHRPPARRRRMGDLSGGSGRVRQDREVRAAVASFFERAAAALAVFVRRFRDRSRPFLSIRRLGRHGRRRSLPFVSGDRPGALIRVQLPPAIGVRSPRRRPLRPVPLRCTSWRRRARRFAAASPSGASARAAYRSSRRGGPERSLRR